MRRATIVALCLLAGSPAFVVGSESFAVASQAHTAVVVASRGSAHGGVLIPKNDQVTLPRHGGTTTSLNWSGYAVTAKAITAVSSAFTVPAAGLLPPGFAATWTGIGGYSSSDLIQAGAAEQSLPTLPLLGGQYYAWYELLPGSEIQLTGCNGDSNCTVNPGDTVTVNISQIAASNAPNNWSIKMTDAGHWNWSKTVTYVSTNSSAEWILEAPTVTVLQSLLAPVTTVSFGPTSTFSTGGSPIDLAQGNPTQIDLSPGVVNEATPSGIASDGQSFDVCAYASSCPTPTTVSPQSAPSSSSSTTTPPTTTPPTTTTPTTPTRPTTTPTTPTPSNGSLAQPVVGMASTPNGGGYWLADAEGGVSPHGNAVSYGSLAGQHLNAPINHIVSTPDGKGYWLVAADGGTFAFGDAGFYGSMGGKPLNAPVVDIAPTSNGRGYWLVASDGGIFAFGDAVFHGSMGGQPLNKPVVGLAPDYATGGYWEVASDGGIFAFGAPFYGSTGKITLDKPVNGMAVTADSHGYWFVASDGGIFSFGDAQFHGSTGGTPLNAPIVGMAADNATGGYWLVASDGGIFSFDAPFYGAD